MTYLMIPYTWSPYLSFKIANEVAAELMLRGKTVFSPISHSHPISLQILDKQTDFEFWMKQDLPILRKCDDVVAVIIGENGRQLIEQSRGCQRELEEVKKLGLKIEYYEYKREGVEV